MMLLIAYPGRRVGASKGEINCDDIYSGTGCWRVIGWRRGRVGQPGIGRPNRWRVHRYHHDPGATQEKGPWRWSLLPCGQDCVHLAAGSGPGWDLHRQGNVWTGTDAANFTVILDNDSLVATMVEPGLPNVVVGMTKNG